MEPRSKEHRGLSLLIALATIVVVLALAFGVTDARDTRADRAEGKLTPVRNLHDAVRREVTLPRPGAAGELSVEDAIASRRSVREFSDEPLTIEQLSRLLWAAQGITGEGGFKRAAPSAGALYPMEIFVVAGRVEGLTPGVYWYVPSSHTINLLKAGDYRGELCECALSQSWIREAPLSLVIAGVYDRTMKKYDERGVRYVHIEVGAVAENVYLQAESLGLGTTLVGAFSDEDVRGLLSAEVSPLGIMPVGVQLR
ncbi:MAG: SagB/ThcOx family dehydrogenase [Candidatus Eisenbacteria bacterium]|nr:SagB/ThcOx family dehydrogenase [Candidatus Eisenbacteria bacterium]